MELNKKSKFAENVKNKILNLQDAIERNNNIEQFIKDYESMKYGLIDTDISFTAEQASILEKHDKNTYFTQEESQFIIKYLMNCLVYNEPFDCSSLGPNKYLLVCMAVNQMKSDLTIEQLKYFCKSILEYK